MTSGRVIHRVAPCWHEDITGFLMRVAERNHVNGPGDLLALFTGSQTGSVRVNDLPALACYCRLTMPEVASLSGIVQRGVGQATAWQVAGEWIRKSAFVASRRAKVCPACLHESMHLRGVWNLTFYTVCAVHRCRLINRCPACRRTLKWNRRYVGRCSCGFDFVYAPRTPAVGPSAQLAWFIDLCTEGECPRLAAPMLDAAPENLGGLSLEGVLKVIWFVGHCVGDLSQCGISHGHAQPNIVQADRIIERAFALMDAWPQRFVQELEQLAKRTPVDSTTPLLDRLLGPAQYYAREEMTTPELAPFRKVYEQIVLTIWRRAGYRSVALPGDRQLTFPFD